MHKLEFAVFQRTQDHRLPETVDKDAAYQRSVSFFRQPEVCHAGKVVDLLNGDLLGNGFFVGH